MLFRSRLTSLTLKPDMDSPLLGEEKCLCQSRLFPLLRCLSWTLLQADKEQTYRTALTDQDFSFDFIRTVSKHVLQILYVPWFHVEYSFSVSLCL